MELPPTIPPRIELPPEPESIPTPPPPPKNLFQKIWGGVLAFLAASWKFAYPAFKLLKGAKILLTAGSMLLSIAFYSTLYGWKFAVGFVICILIHEMGHVFAAWRLGLPVSVPIFIPGMGALILAKKMTRDAWEGAIMGFGGPLFGTVSAFACWGIYIVSGSPLYLGLAFMAFFINLFNMIPAYPLDGGWITGAVSPYIWVAGLTGLLLMAIFGFLHNPMIWLLIILSLPRILQAFKKGGPDSSYYRTTGRQKAIMGLAYVSLCAILMFGVAITLDGTQEIRRNRARRFGQPVTMLERTHLSPKADPRVPYSS